MANNGGPTQTIALQSGSAALQAGDDVLTFTNETLAAYVGNNIIAVANATFLGAGELIQIDNEQMLIQAVNGNAITVVRGYNGTTLSTHALGASVIIVSDQRGDPRTVGGYTDVGAVEQNLTGSAPAAPPSFTYSTFTVTDLSDNPNDDGSLRYFINAVNADTSSNTDIINLAGVSGEIVLSNGALDITRTAGAVVIVGPGSSALTISANALGQVFNFATGTVVSVSGLTIANGYTSGEGAGLFNAGTATITNSVFTNDESTDVFNGGGGIYNSGAMSVVNCTFTTDTGVGPFLSGGAILSTGPLSVLNSTFIGDLSTGAGGGAINDSSVLYVSGSTFTDDSSTGGNSGGAIEESGDLYVTNSTFTNNMSTSLGGAIYSTASISDISGSTFSGNTANYGGGIYVTGTLSLYDSTFTGNSAADNGGGADFSSGYRPGLGQRQHLHHEHRAERRWRRHLCLLRHGFPSQHHRRRQHPPQFVHRQRRRRLVEHGRIPIQLDRDRRRGRPHSRG